MAYFLGAMALWCDWNLVQAVLLSRRLAHDETAGFVLVARITPEENQPEVPHSVEVLPTSGIEWTRNGMATPWRQVAL